MVNKDSLLRISICIYLLLTPLNLFSDPPPVQDGIYRIKYSADIESINNATEFKIKTNFNPESGWYTYYKEPGAFGLPLKVKIEANGEQIQFFSTWPKPETFEHKNGNFSYGYTQPFTIEHLIKEDQLKSGENKLQVTANWLECSKAICIPRMKSLPLTLNITPLHSKIADYP